MKYIFLLGFFFTACSVKNNGATNVTVSQLLEGKKWKLHAITGKLANGTPIPDQYSGLPAYKKDDYFYFKQSLTFTYFANENKEPGNTADILDSGTWSLSNDETVLNLVSTTTPQPPESIISNYPSKIVSITSNFLVLETTDITDGTIFYTTFIMIP